MFGRALEYASEWLRVAFALIELEFRRLMHDRTEIYLRAFQPILWLVLFGPVLGALKAIPTGGVPYIDYIMPGVLIQSTTMVAILFGLIMIWERETGVLKKLVASPSPRMAIVIGRSFAAGVRALFQTIFIIPVALIIGVQVIFNPLYFLLALAVIFVSAGGFAGLSILVASALKSRERFIGLGSAIMFPLFFASNSLYPIEVMPQLIQWFARINPMTYMVSAVRGLMITGDLTGLPADIAAILIFDIVIFAIAAKSFSHIME
ncbi:MAG: ABC transporter permease [Candidatus Micrarchaeia archaeon]